MGIWKGCWLFFTCGPRLSIPIITTGHFDMIPGELRLKAWHSRVMVAFLAVCLQQVVAATPPAERSLDLTLIATATLQISNWNLDLENCPIDLDEEQANRLYDDGMQHLALLLTWCYRFKVMLPKSFHHICFSSSQKSHLRFCATYKALSRHHVDAGRSRYPLRPKLHVPWFQRRHRWIIN